MHPQFQYLNLVEKILDEGEWVVNKRTGKRCLTIINYNMTYDVGAGEFPVISSRTTYWKQAIAEMNGYLRGYNSAKQFRELGAKTWDANANAEIWQKNPYCNGPDDMGRVYGVQGRRWMKPNGGYLDQYAKIVNNLNSGYDDRGEILSFYNPGEFEMGCLRPCMHTHQFSLLNGTVHLNSYQRSIDVGLGLVFNMPQCYYLLAVTAQITGLNPGVVNHNLVNCHIYEDQIPAMHELIGRAPLTLNTKFTISPEIDSLHSLETNDLTDAFSLEGYRSVGPLKIPFSV
jgi:thymidylate synthase